MPTVVRRHPRHGHFSRVVAGQLFQILIAEPGDGHAFGDQPPRFLLPVRLLFEARTRTGVPGIVFAGSGRENRICAVGRKRLWGEAVVMGWSGGGDF